MISRLAVFCGSSPGRRPIYAEAAVALGELLSAEGIGLVYGGGSVGLMGVVADAVLRRGGEVDGVIPQSLVDKEVEHRGCTRLHIVHSMHERKAIMADLADGYVALPGGFGTIEEFSEMVTWAQLGFHQKPCGLLNVDGFYDPLIGQLEGGIEERFVHEDNRGLISVAREPAELLALLRGYSPKPVEKWLDR